MGQIEIKFERMEVEKNKTARIIGRLPDEDNEIEITMSLLQLAKIYNVDEGLVDEADTLENLPVLEQKCKEIREIINKFPDVEIDNSELLLEEVWTANRKDRDYSEKGIMTIFAEDLCGWDNEGIRIKMHVDIYQNYLDESKFMSMLVKQDSIILKDKIELTNEFGEKITTEELEGIYHRVRKLPTEKIDLFYALCGWQEEGNGKNRALPQYKIDAIKNDSKLARIHIKNLMLKTRKEEIDKNLKEIEE